MEGDETLSGAVKEALVRSLGWDGDLSEADGDYITAVRASGDLATTMASSSLISGQAVTSKVLDVVRRLSEYHPRLQAATYSMPQFVEDQELTEKEVEALDAAQTFFGLPAFWDSQEVASWTPEMDALFVDALRQYDPYRQTDLHAIADQHGVGNEERSMG